MENLQGGTLALEHRYFLEARRESAGLITLYEGRQDPFGLSVRVVVYDGLPEAGADHRLVERIKHSATKAGELDVYGVLRATDFGEIDAGLPFFIEEVLPGRSLSTVLADKGVLSLADTVEIIEGLAKILRDAHRVERYHGNLQPRWIWIPEGKAGLSDPRLGHFGMGFSVDELLGMAQAVLTTDLVDALGPECFTSGEEGENRGEGRANLSAEADQWGLAALSYRLLVGVHPFFDDPVDASEGILRIKSEEAPSLTAMGISEEVAEVIARGLRRNPGERWPDVGLFAEKLREAAFGKRAETESAPRVAERPPEAAWQEEEDDEVAQAYLGPRPSGYLLTAALVALLFSNLGWYFYMYVDAPVDGVETVEEEATTLLSGLQLHTSPPGAEIFLLASEEEAPTQDTARLGSSPQVLPVSTENGDPVRVLVRREGYRDQVLTVEETAVGQDVRLFLDPDEGAESQ